MSEFPQEIWRDVALSAVRNLELLLPHVRIGDIGDANARDAYINSKATVHYFKSEVSKEARS